MQSFFILFPNKSSCENPTSFIVLQWYEWLSNFFSISMWIFPPRLTYTQKTDKYFSFSRKGWLAQETAGIPHFSLLVLLHFIDTAFFTKWRSVATLCPACLLAPFFQYRLLALCFSVTFWYFLQYFKLFHYHYICEVICDQRSLMLLVQLFVAPQTKLRHWT